MKLFRWFRLAIAALLDVVYPPACLLCDAPLVGTPRMYLCAACEGQVRFVGEEACPRCGKPRGSALPPIRRCRTCGGRSFAFRRGVVAVRYEGVVQRAVLALKFRKRLLVSRVMGEWLVQALLGREWLREVDLVVPVPLHRRREQERGYNQAAEIAAIVAEAIERPHSPCALVRLRATARQARLPRARRRRNPVGAFGVRLARRKLAGKRVLLVDDVMTTGSTVEACARALLAAGAARVSVAVVAG